MRIFNLLNFLLIYCQRLALTTNVTQEKPMDISALLESFEVYKRFKIYKAESQNNMLII